MVLMVTWDDRGLMGWCRSAQDKLRKNPFIETTLAYVLSYITSVTSSPRIAPASITILADDSYYTTSSPSSTSPTETEKEKRKFSNFHTTISSAHKTGLGSSAALVTSLTTSPPPSSPSIASREGRNCTT